MSIETIITIVVGLSLGLILAVIVFRRVPRKLKPDYFVSEWRDLQTYCRDQQTWPEALIAADKLLDKALKKRKFKGKTMGERLVAAQRRFLDNDDVWFAHNLAKKVITESEDVRLKEREVKEALLSFRDALTDLGALPKQQREVRK